MANIDSEVQTDAGIWLSMSEWDDAELLALVHNDPEHPDPAVTVYWPAREAGAAFASFFETALPRVHDFQPYRTAYDRRLAYASDTGDLENLGPGQQLSFNQLHFVRFEHLQVGDDDIEHPVLIAWCNLNAGRLNEVPVDAGGVRLQTRYLTSLEEPLAKLIANTSAQQPGLGSVVTMLGVLEAYLSGGTEPMVAVG